MPDLVPPLPALQQQAHVSSLEQYWKLVEEAKRDPESFWARRAAETLDWFTPYTTVLDRSDAPFYRWFDGGTLNASSLCLDRHLAQRAEQPAVIWESESGDSETISYRGLYERVNQLANLLKSQFNVRRGDRVALYLPMIPETIVSMLACARLGAVHVVVFGGFSSEVLRERIVDTGATVVITADGASRRGQPYLLKPVVDAALEGLRGSHVPKVLVVEHNHQLIDYVEGRDFHFNTLVPTQPTECPAEHMASEDPLFVLHTSGSTGKPKGIQHTTAGYLLWAQYTTKHVFDMHDGDIFWCTADVGWITGHTYVLYGPLALGATTCLYEGTATYPDAGRWWNIIEKHRVTQFYTAPTAIRLLHKDGPNAPSRYDLSSLKVLGTVGEPINPEAWRWYYDAVGGGRCPIVDTWWQTETGGHCISPLPGATPLKPGSATLPLPGICVEVLQENGLPTPPGEKGLLCITKPWPSMLRTIWNAPERYKSTYFNTVEKDGQPVYFSGDGAYVDDNGYIVVTGRIDDVINVSGHRIGTAEVESVITEHPLVAEAGVVSRPDDITGERMVAFIVLKPASSTPSPTVITEAVNLLLREHIGAVVKISEVVFVPGLPKTRSGKILRRILRSIAHGEPLTADISTLEDPDFVAKILRAYTP